MQKEKHGIFNQSTLLFCNTGAVVWTHAQTMLSMVLSKSIGLIFHYKIYGLFPVWRLCLPTTYWVISAAGSMLTAPSLCTSLKQKDQNTEGKITKAKKGDFSRDLSGGALTRQEKNQRPICPEITLPRCEQSLSGLEALWLCEFYLFRQAWGQPGSISETLLGCRARSLVW